MVWVLPSKRKNDGQLHFYNSFPCSQDPTRINSPPVLLSVYTQSINDVVRQRTERNAIAEMHPFLVFTFGNPDSIKNKYQEQCHIPQTGSAHG